jgi:hypothetical protein
MSDKKFEKLINEYFDGELDHELDAQVLVEIQKNSHYKEYYKQVVRLNAKIANVKDEDAFKSFSAKWKKRFYRKHFNRIPVSNVVKIAFSVAGCLLLFVIGYDYLINARSFENTAQEMAKATYDEVLPVEEAAAMPKELAEERMIAMAEEQTAQPTDAPNNETAESLADSKRGVNIEIFISMSQKPSVVSELRTIDDLIIYEQNDNLIIIVDDINFEQISNIIMTHAGINLLYEDIDQSIKLIFK